MIVKLLRHMGVPTRAPPRAPARLAAFMQTASFLHRIPVQFPHRQIPFAQFPTQHTTMQQKAWLDSRTMGPSGPSWTGNFPLTDGRVWELTPPQRVWYSPLPLTLKRSFEIPIPEAALDPGCRRVGLADRMPPQTKESEALIMINKTGFLSFTPNIVAGLIATAVLLVGLPASGANIFKTKFDNNSATKMNAKIKKNGVTQKSHTINTGKRWTFDYGISKCHHTKVRKFDLYEKQHGRVVGQGQFTMTTGGGTKGMCDNETFTWDSCTDSDANDDFKVSCRTDGFKLGWITIENAD